MDFIDIILKEFKTKEKDEITLEEGVIPITPFIMFSAFKRSAFNKLKKGVQKYDPKAKGREIKAKALQFKEKARATVGQTTGKGQESTVYSLTPEQVQVMADIYNKYGKEMSNDIVNFRKNVLAPYSLIKRIIKEHSRVGSKDVFGMTKDEFMSALESGRKKIESRGENFTEKSKRVRRTINQIDEKLEALEEVENDFKKGIKPNYKILNKIYKEFDVDDKSLEPYTAEQLRRHYESTIRVNRDVKELAKKFAAASGESDSENLLKKSSELRKKQDQLMRGKLDIVDLEKEKFYSKDKFDTAFGKYLFRKNIIDELKPYKDNVYVATYFSIIDKLQKRFREIKKEKINDLVRLKKNSQFTDKEAKIWKKRPGVVDDSSKIEDYYQAIKEEDFLGRAINIERSDKLKEAEQEIENEIKRFERNLARTVSVEDLAKLKRYRLINNLITFKELKEPDKLFKTSLEIKKSQGSSIDDGEETKDYISPDKFLRRIKEVATMEFDSMDEFNKAKAEVKNLVAKLREQGDSKIIKKYEDILYQIEKRRTPVKSELKGHRFEKETMVSIKDIEDFAKKIATTNYGDDVDKAKQDRKRLDQMIEDFKNYDEDSAEKLNSIKFLLDKVGYKLRGF